MDNWNDYSIDEIMANIEEPSSWAMEDGQFAGYIADLPEEVFEDKPVKMNFNKLFELKLAREKYIKKFGINQQYYEVKVANLPYHLGNNASMRVLLELFTAIFDICTEDFLPDDRLCIELHCGSLDRGSIYLPVTKFSKFSVDTLLAQMERLNSSKKFCIDESFKIRLTKITLPGGGGKRRINMYPFAKRKRLANSIVTVSVGGNLCLPAALFLRKYRLTHDIAGAGENDWKNLRRADGSHRLEQKVRMELIANQLPHGVEYSLVDIDHIQRVLYPDYQIKVSCCPFGNQFFPLLPQFA